MVRRYHGIVPGRKLPYLNPEAIKAVSLRDLALAGQLGVTINEYLCMIDPKWTKYKDD